MTNKEAIEWLKRIEERYILNGDEGFDKARKEALHMAIEALENNDKLAEDLQNCLEMYKKKKAEVKALEHPHGEWRYGENDIGLDGYWCTVCGGFVLWDYKGTIDFIHRYNYCPNCGSDMRERREDV